MVERSGRLTFPCALDRGRRSIGRHCHSHHRTCRRARRWPHVGLTKTSLLKEEVEEEEVCFGCGEGVRMKRQRR